MKAYEKDPVTGIVRHLDDRRKLPERVIVLENPEGGRFERRRQYSPSRVIDALAAILNDLTGETFGLSYNKATDPERDQALAGWRIYAGYLAGK